jgi:hypothetical protein
MIWRYGRHRTRTGAILTCNIVPELAEVGTSPKLDVDRVAEIAK